MLNIIKDLTPLNRVFCSSDYDNAITYLQKQLPFKVVSFHENDELNGWVIPPKWDVADARIIKNGRTIYDATKNPLSVIALSKSYKGVVTLDELKKHLYYDNRFDDAIPYHFRQMYRSWDRDWGMCVTKNFYDSLTPGNYDVVIETLEEEGELKVMEYSLQGKHPQTFVFVAHLDHPGMSNDDLAGCAVGVELFKRLAGKSLKYSYSLILLPEIMGSEYYLHSNDKINDLMESLFLDMLGTNTQLALQESMHSDSNIEKAVINAMDSMGAQYRTGPFKSIIGNDESIWETYGIPMASISRYPYPEYHTDKDNISIISEQALDEALNILLKTVESLEGSRLIKKKFKGNICLSNPKFDLYIDPGQPAFDSNGSDSTKGMRLLMDLIPTLHKPVSIDWIAEKVGLDEVTVEGYLKKWEEKNLIMMF